MDPAQNRRGDDQPAAPRHALGHLLVDTLMRPRAIVVGHIGPQRPAQMGLSQDQQVVQTLPANTPQESLADRIGPGSMSGAESFAGPLQATGRATLVGERTAGLCGGAHHVMLVPGWEIWITAWEPVFGPTER